MRKCAVQLKPAFDKGMKTKKDKNEKDVAAYLAALPVEKSKALERLREAIRAAAPEAEEGFSYGVPAFKIKGKALVCFAAFKNHCGFYPMSPNVLNEFALELADYETSQGTIRFDPKNPLPEDLVQKIVKARLKEVRD